MTNFQGPPAARTPGTEGSPLTGGAPPSEPRRDPRGRPSTSAPAPTSGPLLDYTRSGGFAGLRDHLVVEPSGEGTVTHRSGRREIHLGAERLAKIQAVFAEAGFDRLKSEYPGRGADLLTHTIIYKGSTVTAMDGTVPPDLEPVIRMLNDLVNDDRGFAGGR